MKLTLAILAGLLVSSCANKETTAEAQKKLDDNWTPKVGVATKQELLEVFGEPLWCKQEDGTETCRFYNKKGTAFTGEQKRDKKPHEKYDQLIAEFDSAGVLKGFKSTAQR